MIVLQPMLLLSISRPECEETYMEHEFINDRLAYFRISMKDRIWFFKHDGKVDAIAIPDGSHFTLSGHTDREVLSQMFERPFGKKYPSQVRCAVLSVFHYWL